MGLLQHPLLRCDNSLEGFREHRKILTMTDLWKGVQLRSNRLGIGARYAGGALSSHALSGHVTLSTPWCFHQSGSFLSLGVWGFMEHPLRTSD